MKDLNIICPSSLELPGNVLIRVFGKNRIHMHDINVHNNATDEGKLYILYCLVYSFTPIITNFAITTDKGIHIFEQAAIEENDRGSLVRDVVTTISGAPRARFKFYLQTNQLNGEVLQYIHLYARDRNGNLFAAFTANHALGENSQLITKNDEMTVSYEWQIGIKNASDLNG